MTTNSNFRVKNGLEVQDDIKLNTITLQDVDGELIALSGGSTVNSSLFYKFNNNLTDEAGNTGLTLNGETIVADEFSKWGGYSLLVGTTLTNSNFATINETTAGILNIGTGDYTVEGWIYIPSTASSVYNWGFMQLGPYIWGIDRSLGDASPRPAYYDATSYLATTQAIPLDEWIHICWSRLAGQLYIGVNGVVESIASLSSDIQFTGVTQLGADQFPGESIQGYIDSVRITPAALYTSNYTIPTAEFTALVTTVEPTSAYPSPTNIFDQTLNTTDSPSFTEVTAGGINLSFDGDDLVSIDNTIGHNFEITNTGAPVSIKGKHPETLDYGAVDAYHNVVDIHVHEAYVQQATWSFTADGSLTFPDNTVQTTAYTGTAFTSFDQGLNTTDSPSFTEVTAGGINLSGDGSLTFPDNTVQTTAYTGGISPDVIQDDLGGHILIGSSLAYADVVLYGNVTFRDQAGVDYFKFPATGELGQVLTYNGSGYTQWTDPNTGILPVYTRDELPLGTAGGLISISDSYTDSAAAPAGNYAIAYWEPDITTWIYVHNLEFVTPIIDTSYSIDYLVVAGGAGAGPGGGGGAGGMSTGTHFIASSGTSYTITVGAGGSGSSASGGRGVAGSNSSLGFVSTSTGGGGGGANSAEWIGGDGGSGGGGGLQPGSGINGGTGISGQGNDGGAGYGSAPYTGGGGGGAGYVGQAGTDTYGGDGGDGLAWYDGVTYAGGGGGTYYAAEAATDGAGGAGGGGNAVWAGGTAATANTGGGGGAGSANGNHAGAAGGSGVVIIRYSGTPRGTGGTITEVDGYTYHTFTSSDTYIS
ncbi:hypothetical protein UFOVP635_15 [uncultured Caudovirales phage]|uniref:Glycine-rich domain-containing protein n=1 Tax=uncultured Caudovirales phage TaxID=2100421 RepID=A0A6J5N937_9CAUD|nr:hypothetical protein UFOVP635_15 [uncultured Caudovirales phage]